MFYHNQICELRQKIDIIVLILALPLAVAECETRLTKSELLLMNFLEGDY
jgi:hypothetical protein